MNYPVLAVDILSWPILQLAIARASLSMPDRSLITGPATSRLAAQEMHFYRRALHIRSWKHLLADGAAWVGGTFRKRNLKSRRREDLRRFALEARRGECAHWCMIGCAPLFFLWNPPWASAVMILYALAANLPCIAVQRYNRLVIAKKIY